MLLCFINLILGNRYGPGVFSCQKTSHNVGWPDPHPSPGLRRWLYRSPPLLLRTETQLPCSRPVCPGGSVVLFRSFSSLDQTSRRPISNRTSSPHCCFSSFCGISSHSPPWFTLETSDPRWDISLWETSNSKSDIELKSDFRSGRRPISRKVKKI